MISLNAPRVSIGIAPRIDCVTGSQPQLCPRVDAIITAGAKARLCKHAHIRLVAHGNLCDRCKRDLIIESAFFLSQSRVHST